MKYCSQTLIVGLCLLWVHPSLPYQTQQRDRAFLRIKRNECQGGAYLHGKSCCCGAGQRLERHCTEKVDPVCVDCKLGETFNSVPNSRLTCEICTSCSHPNANLEVKEECTILKDTVCQCKEDHYCDSQICLTCHPCEKCDGTGIMEPCTRTNNTVCNEEKTEGTNIGLIIGILMPIAVLTVVGILLLYWKCRHSGAGITTLRYTNGMTEGQQMEQEPLTDDLMPHVTDIAAVVGWKDMRDIARKSGIPITCIEDLMQDYSSDSKERTVQLLMVWVQKQGRKAPEDLIQNLRSMQRNAKAEKIIHLIRGPSHN